MRPDGGPGRDVLYRDEAAARAARVHNVRYGLQLELAAERQTYTGRAVIEFHLRSTATPLWLDFTGTPTSLSLNGAEVEPDHRDHRLWIGPEHLRMHNRVVVGYENRFDATGDGVHRFVDPEDGATYVYSNLEPFSAHRLFPCFDQPDIKAIYRLLVSAPAGWSVVSAETPVEVSPLPDGRGLHEFPSTAPFSTYLLGLVAGPFEHHAAMHGGIPLGLYGRASMRAELERAAPEVLELTAQGMDYYADLFGRAYPFRKYDQLFVPEFNAGAMENVAAVTFNDAYLFRDPPTYAQRLVRGEVILHELAHMWFGNLVTMRWWDDLWLNETFATYLSYRCLAEATRFDDAWLVFNGQMRPAAYRQDQLRTTHPVATRVEHTDQAVGNFDAITYEKGAAVMKQLVAAVGERAFRRGLRAYIQRHAWGNASLDDLLGALAEATGAPLDEWARLWLRTASIDTIGVRWSVADGVIEQLELHQTAAPGQPLLRPHAMDIALVGDGAERGLALESIAVRIEGASQAVPEAVGRPAPLFVYPDHGDHDYALVELDDVSLAFALERLPELPDALLRQQVWSTLWEMVRATRLRSSDYLETVCRFAPRETDPALVQSVVERALVVQRRYVPETSAAATDAALTRVAITALRSTSDPALRLVWARAAAAAVTTPAELAELLDLIDGRWSVRGFEPDQQLRWTLTAVAVAHGRGEGLERVERERRRDGSDRGRRAATRALVSQPDADVKREAWERVHAAGYGSDYATRAAISGFQWVHQRELLRPFRSPFYERVADVYATRDHAYAESYLHGLVPDRWAEREELERMRAFVAGLDGSQDLLRRHLQEVADDVERDIRVRAFAADAVAIG